MGRSRVRDEDLGARVDRLASAHRAFSAWVNLALKSRLRAAETRARHQARDLRRLAKRVARLESGSRGPPAPFSAPSAQSPLPLTPDARSPESARSGAASASASPASQGRDGTGTWGLGSPAAQVHSDPWARWEARTSESETVPLLADADCDSEWIMP